ncbi:hypothetical protein ACQP06_08070 [Nocardia sp. CA-136227]|uniref:hypothetical protein n=1 Tax=Nocardia sp. CA-136227 TaxID=3239979 RepID=UPI003D980E0F
MRITVCLPAEAGGRVEGAVGVAMAPFELDYTRGEDLDIWDTWRIVDGTAGSGLPVLAGVELDSRLLHQSPTAHQREGARTTHVAVPNEFGWCAGGPRVLLDLPTARQYREPMEMMADAVWVRWHELASGLPAARPRDAFYESPFEDPDSTGCDRCDQQSADYSDQPLVRAFRDYLGTVPTTRAVGLPSGLYDPVNGIGKVTRSEFVARAAERAVPHRNILSLEGWWYEDGWSGIHGACDDPDRCPHEPDIAAGYDHIADYLAALPADTLLVNLRCHV